MSNSTGAEAEAEAVDTSETAQPAAAPKTGGMRALLLRSSAYEMIGYGASQVVRFGSNLVLTRLLFPEAFGLMVYVNTLNQGLMMLSDVGIPTMIVQSERGDDLRFLNTAFTWQAARSVLLWIASALVALPMAWFYHAPELRVLIPIGAASVLILGIKSTAYHTMRRRLSLFPLMLIELGSQSAAVAVMITWATTRPSVWALIGGTLTSSIATVAGSYMLRVGYKNRFEWDKESVRSMLEFGKWVAGSSMLTFASNQGDRLVLGYYLPAATLGVYGTAVMLSSALGDAIGRITHGVFFPAYSRVRDDGLDRLRQMFYRTRLAVDALVLPALGGLAVLGPFVVNLLFDKRYAEAGWMLRILAIRVAIASLSAPAQFALFALGQTQYGFFLNLARVVCLAIGVPLGFHAAGVKGLLWAVTLSEVPAMVVVYSGVVRARLLSVKHELRVPLFYAAGLGLGYGCLMVLQMLGFA